MKIAGIALIVIGVIALSYQFISFNTTQKDAQLGPIQIQHQETHTIPVPPIIGAVCIVAGVVSLAAGARNSL